MTVLGVGPDGFNGSYAKLGKECFAYCRKGFDATSREMVVSIP